MKTKSGKKLPPMKHKEAFCLMKYMDETTGYIEWLWNSRDGITPFSIAYPPRAVLAPPSHAHLTHVDWHEDVFVPNFVPPVGMRIFADNPVFRIGDTFNFTMLEVNEQLHLEFRQRAFTEPYLP